MVNITNGIDTFVVSKGAFEGVFKSQGYFIAQQEKVANKPEIQPIKVENEDITEKPISKWTSEELKAFAKDKNIDLSKVKSTKDAREIVKEYLEKE